MRYQALIVILSVVLAGCADTSNGSSTILDPSQGPVVLVQQRPTPKAVNSFWLVTPEIARDIDKRIDRVRTLRSDKSMMVEDPSDSLRQYVGIVVDGKRLVYINALPTFMDNLDWKTQAMQTADGGPLIWGVVYDPSTGDFQNLATNSCFGWCG